VALLSPAPTPVAEIHAHRLLVAHGRFDIPAFSVFAPTVADIGGARADSIEFPWGGHSAAIFNPGYVSAVVKWIAGGDPKSNTLARQVLLIVMLISGVVFGASLLPARPVRPPAPSVYLPLLLVRYVVACGVAIVVLKAVNPLSWLRAFGMDYLVGYMFVAGVILWLQKPEMLTSNRTALVKAGAAAAFVILVLGFGAASLVIRMGLGGGRWWRFPIMVLALLPLFAFDELNLRLPSIWKSAAAAVLTRMLLVAFLTTGLLLLNREAAFLVIIAHLIVVIWLALWWAAGAIRRHTHDPASAALFSALVHAWVCAAIFVKL
jgi:hypothetical protein